jgi:hypothetical protein
MARDPILESALSIRLAVKKIAKEADISTAAVSMWTRVPKKHLEAVERVTGIPQCKLRPDLFPAEVAA